MSITAFATHNGGRLQRWLSTRHRLRSEAAAVLGLYGLYEAARGLVVSDAREADHDAREVVTLERALHLFGEAHVQHAVRVLPGLTSLLGTAYLTLHLAVTAGVLLWLHERRPAAFAFVRTTLLLASALAAVPSMHIGYALIVAASLLLYARRRLVRALGALYPPVVLLVVVATGNHFFFDAAAGALVAVVAAAAAAPLTRRAAPNRISELPTRPEPLPAYEELAA
jgi:hypothetical protein